MYKLCVSYWSSTCVYSAPRIMMVMVSPMQICQVRGFFAQLDCFSRSSAQTKMFPFIKPNKNGKFVVTIRFLYGIIRMAYFLAFFNTFLLRYNKVGLFLAFLMKMVALCGQGHLATLGKMCRKMTNVSHNFNMFLIIM